MLSTAIELVLFEEHQEYTKLSDKIYTVLWMNKI